MRRFLNTNSKKITIIMFLLISVILGYFVAQLGLYVDDNVLIFPAVLKSFASHFIQYNYDNGLFRPITLFFYYFIYSLYSLSPQIAHLLPFVLHIISGFLLIKLLKKQGVNLYLALCTGLFFILHPFATEQYMYLSATTYIFVNSFFIIQAMIIDDSKVSNKTSLLVFLLSLLSVFTLESTFFFFIPLSYLLTTKFTKSISNKKKIVSNLVFGAILFIPNILYLLSKITFPAHVLTPRLTINNLGDLLNNFHSMLKNISILYINSNAISNFWLSNIQDGLNMLSKNYFILALFILFIFFLIKFIIQTGKSTNQKIANSVLVFWWLTFFASLLPLLVLKEFNFPFRTLFLPSGIFFIALFISINKFFNKELILRIVSLLILCIAVSFLLIDISIATKYKKQSDEDINLSKRIKMLLSENYFNDQKPTYLIIDNFPHSTVYSNFIHADHILSCYHYWWCGQAALNMITGMVKDIGIEFKDNLFSSKTELPINTFLNQRPLVIMEYLSNGNLEINKIFAY